MAKLAGRLKAPPREPGCCATAEEGAEGSVLGGWFHDRERERGRERVIERERTIRSVARSDESGESIVENERTNERTSKRTNERNELRTYTKHGKWWLAIVLRGRKNRLLFSSALTFSPFGGFGELYTRISRGAGTLEIDVMFRGNTSAA